MSDSGWYLSTESWKPSVIVERYRKHQKHHKEYVHVSSWQRVEPRHELQIRRYSDHLAIQSKYQEHQQILEL